MREDRTLHYRGGKQPLLPELAPVAPPDLFRNPPPVDPATREAYTPTEAECAAFGNPFDPSLRFYRPGPEAAGRNAGYKGRTGLYELIVIDETLRRMIHEGASEAMLIAHARKNSPAMLEDGWNKVIASLTSADEVLRVTRDE
ncbi:MAG TPA: hypothetical protein VFN29_06165 [Chiayiivirga sp.]|nr:hypothetical protein [Chiayiivirga sp.]